MYDFIAAHTPVVFMAFRNTIDTGISVTLNATLNCELSPRVIGPEPRVSSSRALAHSPPAPEQGREQSVLTAEITPSPLTTLNTFPVLLHLPSIAVGRLDLAGALKVLHSMMCVHRQAHSGCFSADNLCSLLNSFRYGIWQQLTHSLC